MLDIVVGDMAWAGNASTIDYSTFNPFNDQKYFHDYKLLSEDSANKTCVLDVSLSSRVMRAVLSLSSVLDGRQHHIACRSAKRGSGSPADSGHLGFTVGFELLKYVYTFPISPTDLMTIIFCS
jgi:hypothetical protein